MGQTTNSFLIALNFLTVFNFGKGSFSSLKDVGRSSWAFPLVGIFIGVILVVAQVIANYFVPLGVAALLTVGVWIFVTGGLHLDGWSDCWDAFGASVSKDRRLEILKDSRLGSFGAMSLFILLGLKVSCLSSGLVSYLELILAAALGRSVLVICFRHCEHTSPGMAHSFITGIDSRAYGFMWFALLPVVIICGIDGIISTFAAIAATFLFKRIAESKLGLINGDVLGASCELTETIVLITSCWG
ncbi:MAG: adenosylcobinamide-GDP ribazoletransferase [Syntrophaceae bacterium]|nr:adenosylcobinamide-GDP ribazoletransferase [Syntrophaceae bacterium]